MQINLKDAIAFVFLLNELTGRLHIYKVNVGYEQELVDRYEVQASPTLIFFRDGAEVSRLRGSVKKADILAEFEKIQ